MAFLRDWYKSIILSNKRWIAITVAGFILAIFAGVGGYYLFPSLIEKFVEFFQNLVGTSQPGNSQLVWIIYRQNVTSCLVALFGGIVFGIAPIIILAVNGFMIGYVVTFIAKFFPGSAGAKTLFIVASLLPHGIFELTIVLLSGTLGIRLGTGWLFVPHDQRGQTFKQDFFRVLKFLPVMLVVLALAAVIEVYVSGSFAQALTR